MRWLGITLVAALAFGCGSRKEEAPPPKPGGLGTSIADTAQDTATMRAAQAAVNEVIRNATDCQLAKPAAEEAFAKLETARGAVKTGPALNMLDTMKKQVEAVVNACP